MYVSTETKLHFSTSFQILMVILITILNYKIFFAKKSPAPGTEFLSPA